MKKTIVAIGLALSMMSASVYAGNQPLMERALNNLERAEKLLQKSARNKGGHRVKALIHVKKAIAEVKAGMAHANKK